MAFSLREKQGATRIAVRVAGLYLLVAIVWEVVLHSLFGREEAEVAEAAFILFSALLLTWLIRRNVRALRLRDEKVKTVAQRLSVAGGEALFPLMAQNLAEVLDAPCATIEELGGEGNRKLCNLGAWVRGGAVRVPHREWEGTAAETPLRDRRAICLADGVRERFPDPLLPQAGEWESFLGAPLLDSEGRSIGLVAVMGERDLCSREEIDTVLPLFVVRAAAELERLRVEDALRESEERSRCVIQATNDAVWNLDLRTQKITINEGAERLFGYRLEGASVGFEWWTERLHPDDRERVLAKLDDFTEGDGPSWSDEYRFRRADGSYADVLDRGYKIVDRHGKVQSMVGTILDFTERKRAQEERSRLAAIVESSDDAVISKTAEETIATWNRGAEEIYGYCAAEVLGKPISILFPPGRTDEEINLLRKYREGTVVRGYETERVRKDGRLIPVSLTISPIRDPEGGIAGASVIARDITDRKEADVRLRESEERFRRIVETAQEGIWVVDAEGKATYVNRRMAEILRRNEEEVIGRPVVDFVEEELRDDFLARFEERKRGIRGQYETAHRLPDGSEVWMRIAAVPMFGPGGEFIGSFAMVSDITERRRAEMEIRKLNASLAARASELEAANSELEAFSYTVSHDLRKPLTAVNGFCQLLTTKCADSLDESCRDYLREIYRQSVEMNRLIETLLDFSSLTRCEPKRETVELSRLSEDVAAGLRAADPARKAAFLIEKDVTVKGDVELLRVVLENLLGNAWKYTSSREEAVVEVGRTQRDGEAVCFVRDNGAGFDMAHADKLFTPFQRLPGAGGVEGYGIGLAIVQRIVQRHGGRVWGESEKGKGATFYFTLP